MFLRKLTVSILFLVCILFNVFSQESPHHFGVDVTKTIHYYRYLSFNDRKGYGVVFEPVYLYQTDSNIVKFKVPVGIAHTNIDGFHNNSNFTTTGFYLKPGIGFSWNTKFVPYLSFIISDYNIHGNYTLEGSYHGDYSGSYTHKNCLALGIEHSIDFKYTITPKMSMLLTFRVAWVFYNPKVENNPANYIPGAGVIPDESFVDNGDLTGGVNLTLFW